MLQSISTLAKMFASVFVDDMTFASPSLDVIKHTLEKLCRHFKIHDLRPTVGILGIKIDHNCAICSLPHSQCQDCVEMLECFAMGDCMPVSTPMDPGLSISCSQLPQTPTETSSFNRLWWCCWLIAVSLMHHSLLLVSSHHSPQILV